LRATDTKAVGIGVVNESTAHSSWGWVADDDDQLVLLEGSTQLECLTYTGYHGFLGITDPSAGVDTPTLRVRAGASDDYVATSTANGSVVWTNFGDLGYSPWSALSTISSISTLVTVAQVVFAVDLTRAGQTWVGVYEVDVYLRTASNSEDLCIFKFANSIAVSYDGSGNATVAAVTAQTNGTETLGWQNHSGGVPTISSVGFGAASGNTISVVVTKPAGGAESYAKTRWRAMTIARTDDWI
jgi:hypothetical protein